VLRAEGREARGQCNAAATITATVTPHGTGSAVKVVTDLTITGKVAQFGRGVLADVSTRLLKDFADCLARDLEAAAAGPAEPAVAVAPTPRPAPPPMPTPTPVAAVDLVATAGAPVAKRAAPLVAVLFLAYWLTRRRRRRRRRAKDTA
jgi:hypothetical protein